jgi:hypothetical protein
MNAVTMSQIGSTSTYSKMIEVAVDIPHAVEVADWNVEP